MALLKQSTAYTRMFLMVDSTDHITGKTGLTVTVTLSKAGGAFGAAGGTITEVSSGWYKIALTTTDTNTLGDLAYHCTSTGADATDIADQVILFDLAVATQKVDVDTIKTQTVTCAAGVTVLASVGTASTSTAQTGDAYARLGAPAGASVSADVAAVKVDTAAVKVKTDFLPSATAGAAGGVFIAGANAATTVNITGNLTGNVTGSVGSVTGAVGSVTGAVGSVTGAVGSVSSGGIDATAITTAGYNAIADGVLDRNMATGTDSGTDSTVTRTPRQAMRLLRNKAVIAAGTLTVRKEDDSTASWTAAISTTAGNPISTVDPT
jgi:hypothetical protein